MFLSSNLTTKVAMPKVFTQLTSANNFHSSRLKGKVAVVTASTEG